MEFFFANYQKAVGMNILVITPAEVSPYAIEIIP